MFGVIHALVLTLEWLTLFLTIGPLPVSSHRRDMSLSSSSALKASVTLYSTTTHLCAILAECGCLHDLERNVE